MHGLAPSYFAFNTQDRRALFKLVDERKLLTMADDARKAINDAVADAEFILTPIYALKPQQRLGYLEEIDKIMCIKSGLRKLDKKQVAFKKGEEYDVRVSSATIVQRTPSGNRGTRRRVVRVARRRIW